MQGHLRALTNQSFKIRQSLTELQDAGSLTKKQVCESSQAVTEQIRNLNDKIEKLVSDVQEECVGSERQTLLDELDVHRNEVQNLKVLLRKAILQCTENREKQHKREREQLFAGSSKSPKFLKNPTDEILLQESQATNNTMFNLRRAMVELLDHGTAVNERIEQSSALIHQSMNEHHHIEEELQTAKHLMTSFKIKNMTDRLLLVVALVFYVSVCLYVLLSRLKTPFSSIFYFISYFFSITNSPEVLAPELACATTLDGVCTGI